MKLYVVTKDDPLSALPDCLFEKITRNLTLEDQIGLAITNKTRSSKLGTIYFESCVAEHHNRLRRTEPGWFLEELKKGNRVWKKIRRLAKFLKFRGFSSYAAKNTFKAWMDKTMTIFTVEEIESWIADFSDNEEYIDCLNGILESVRYLQEEWAM